MSEFYTLTYSPSVSGWPSFYTFNPDWMLGMNQFFYTFKGGNLYQHNTNALANTFYGVSDKSILKSVFNDMPIDNKLFKTLAIEGNSSWAATLVTDIQDSGFIERPFYEKKEGVFFSFVRNQNNAPASLADYPLRSVNGLGSSLSVTGTVNNPIINFALQVDLGSIISVGDLLYFAVLDTPLLAGQITDVQIDKPQGINRIVIDATIPNSNPIVGQTPYFLYIKNTIAESHGVLGHYCTFTLENNDLTKSELFVVRSEVMKSYP
jgi:hypothetical protein